MPARHAVRAVIAAAVSVVVVGCTVPGPARSAAATQVPTATGASAGDLIAAGGFTMTPPAGWVDVTERAAPNLRAAPLFTTPGLTLLKIYAVPTEPGVLDHALVAGLLADGEDPKSLASDLAARAGQGSSVREVSIAGNTWYRFAAAVGTSAAAQDGVGAVCRFNGRNILLVEGPESGDHPTLWAVAASLSRAS